MRRRDFIMLLGGAAAAWPLAVRAQQPKVPVIGYLSATSQEKQAPLITPFLQGLHETGFVEGRNAAIEYRWAEDKYDRLPVMAADLVDRQVDVLVVAGNTPAALAAKAATHTIPIVFTNGSDPVEVGLVDSLNRPGGNATGMTTISVSLVPKRLELLHEIAPGANTIAFLVNSSSTNFKILTQEMEAAANRIGLQLIVVTATGEGDFAGAFMNLVQRGAGALVVSPDTIFNSHADRLIALAAQFHIPSIYGFREYATAGGLISYGTDLADANRQIGVYAGRILKGEKPADLPVLQPTKFEFVFNLKTAKALGLTIPLTMQYAADEVIE
jgi:putative ABC transport system substrate-binding protein